MSSETPDVLTEHRICNARYGQVACYCSALVWMTLDEYGEHVEAISAARVAAERERAAAAEAKIAAVEALAEEAVQRAYMQIARDRMLTVMPIDPARTRAVVPDHWRAEAEEAASVPVTDLLAALGGEATP